MCHSFIHMLCHSVSCFKVCIGIVVSVPSDIWDESKQGGVGQGFWQSGLDYFIQSSIENAESEEELDAEVKIFQNALDFSNIKIRDCIVPRTEVVAVDLTTTLEELKCLFVESGISKIIVYDGNIDNVVGYIHSSEMFRNPVDWRNNVKEVPIVPETMSAHKLMKLFMQQKKRLL